MPGELLVNVAGPTQEETESGARTAIAAFSYGLQPGLVRLV